MLCAPLRTAAALLRSSAGVAMQRFLRRPPLWLRRHRIIANDCSTSRACILSACAVVVMLDGRAEHSVLHVRPLALAAGACAGLAATYYMVKSARASEVSSKVVQRYHKLVVDVFDAADTNK